MMDGETVRNT